VILVAGLPLLTLALVAGQHHLSLADDLLIYLVAVIAVAVVGGFWPAVLAAVTASLLLNWYFTVPVHTLAIADPHNLLALLLFVTVAVTVSSVVHLSAHRARQADRSAGEAAQLLSLAQTVLGGADTPAAVLAHLTGTCGGSAELLEQVSGQWVRVAASGNPPVRAGWPGDEAASRVEARADLVLVVDGQAQPVTSRLLAGFAAQAASALDRDRLRTQASQAEALAEGNRMRTALLAAVSHDLRSPIASAKAAISSLRSEDIDWDDADSAELLATADESLDRLTHLVGNLLDMSRLQAGALSLFPRPSGLDEIIAMSLDDLGPAGREITVDIPDALPAVRADPAILERIVVNLTENALRYSPAGKPPLLAASALGDRVELRVVDRGPGIPEGDRDRMFVPFQRLGDTDNTTGVGLGLALARGLTEAMDGTLTAEDTPGGGLTMIISLPAAPGN